MKEIVLIIVLLLPIGLLVAMLNLLIEIFLVLKQIFNIFNANSKKFAQQNDYKDSHD